MPKASTVCPTAAPYHHGDLREALVAAAVAVLEERGLEALSLRECARRAGVSHGAPAHHFGDLRGLLGEVAALGYERTAARMQAARVANGADARAALVGVGVAYVESALRDRALFALMHRSQVFDACSSRLRVAADDTRRHLVETLQAACAPEGGALPPNFDARAALAWSAVHGFAQLALEGAWAAPAAAAHAAAHDGMLMAMLEAMGPALLAPASVDTRQPRIVLRR